MNGNDYQSKAMRTDDRKGVVRLYRKINTYHEFNDVVPSWEKTSDYDIGSIINACFGLSGEVGETVDIVKKWIFHEKELDETHLKKEIGDIMWYIAQICYGFGFDLDEIMQMNIDKLLKRYPNDFNTYDTNHRKSDDI